MHSALLVVVTLVASSAFTLPRPPLTRNLKFARPAADGVEDTGAADGMDAVAAPASVVVDDAVEPAAPTAPAAKKSFKKRPIDPERAATKFVKTATNAATWKNHLLYGSLAFAVLLSVALLALAQK
jgi:hypothetical protein